VAGITVQDGTVDLPNPLAELTLDELRTRRSVKWNTYPPDVLPLWVAEMDAPLAPSVRAALLAAVERGDTGYAHPGGLAEAYAGFAAARLGWAPDPATARLVPDVMNGVVAVLDALVPAGSTVVLNTPAYPPFFSFLRGGGWRVVESPLTPTGDGGYALDLDRLDHDLAGAAAYLLCNPHNPTGTVFDRATLVGVAERCARRGVRVLADEIHAPLTYPGVEFVPYLAVTDDGVAMVSASKAWNLPGLKAALAVPGPRVDLSVLPPEVSFGAGLLGVIAAEAAFRSGGQWLDALLAALDHNRRLLAALLADALPQVGYRLPDATYLAWLDCRRLGLGDDPSVAFLDRKVAVNPGPSFGLPGHGFVRLNLATSPAILTAAVQRMAAAVA
jgi:cystathionine beta-lyase